MISVLVLSCSLHAGLATNHQNMPRKLIIGTQSARLTSQHQNAETTKSKHNLQIPPTLHVTRPFMVIANNINAQLE